MFVGEGPGADEDAQGIPFVGRAGQLLTQMIEGTATKEGIPLKRADVYICNVVKCRPPENRTPEPDEMEICGQFLFRQLSVIQPKAICALGSTAAKALLGGKDGVTKLRGKWHKWRDIPLIVTYHPSYLLRPYNQNAEARGVGRPEEGPAFRLRLTFRHVADDPEPPDAGAARLDSLHPVRNLPRAVSRGRLDVRRRRVHRHS